MNKRQKKSLAILLGLLAVLVIVLAVVLTLNHRNATKAEEEAAASTEASHITPTDITYTALSYTNGTTALSFAQNDSGVWYWTEDPDFPLDNDAITKLINTITGLTPQQVITDGDALSAYGLDAPNPVLTATTSDGDTLTFALGNQAVGAADGDYYMAMNGDTATIYVITDTLYGELTNSIYDMMSLPQLPILTEAQISTISVNGAVSTALASIVSENDDTGDTSADATPSVTWRSDGANVTDSGSVSSLVTQVSTLTLSSCYAYKPTDEQVAQCGFGDGQTTVTVTYTESDNDEQTFTLVIGAATADASGNYVRVVGDSTIYTMAADGLTSILSVAASGLAA